MASWDARLHEVRDGYASFRWARESALVKYQPNLVRTAYDGAHNFHDSNRITFHRLPAFRAALAERLSSALPNVPPRLS